uniref:Uncharacterized protein n=1 Tax=Grammatophora oceanica TaxID=210454 RepID=A0A7S1VK13_9STRA|mmetsp:Transcript_48666/g.72669  ORF Transcript_48666/g.72669 Transcript_48666/m.72669 type:complete len:415 (+) Transcript_48666:573-1817(+)
MFVKFDLPQPLFDTCPYVSLTKCDCSDLSKCSEEVLDKCNNFEFCIENHSPYYGFPRTFIEQDHPLFGNRDCLARATAYVQDDRWLFETKHCSVLTTEGHWQRRTCKKVGSLQKATRSDDPNDYYDIYDCRYGHVRDVTVISFVGATYDSLLTYDPSAKVPRRVEKPQVRIYQQWEPLSLNDLWVFDLAFHNSIHGSIFQLKNLGNNMCLTAEHNEDSDQQPDNVLFFSSCKAGFYPDGQMWYRSTDHALHTPLNDEERSYLMNYRTDHYIGIDSGCTSTTAGMDFVDGTAVGQPEMKCGPNNMMQAVRITNIVTNNFGFITAGGLLRTIKKESGICATTNGLRVPPEGSYGFTYNNITIDKAEVWEPSCKVVNFRTNVQMSHMDFSDVEVGLVFFPSDPDEYRPGFTVDSGEL